MNAAGEARAGWIAVAVVISIWTGFILLTRHSGTGTLTSWDIAALRFGTGALVAIFFLPRIVLPPLKVIALFSFFGGIGYAITVYAAFRMSPATHASILLPGTLPFVTALIAWLWFRRKPPPAYRTALVAVLAGVVLTAADSFSPGSLTRMQITGDLLFLCGSSSWAVFTLLLGRYSIGPLAATVTTALGSALIYLPAWCLFLPSSLAQAPFAEIAAQALYQGVLVVFISMLLYSFAINRLGPHTVALQMAFVPVISALAAVLLLDEPISLLALAGLFAVTTGAVFGARTANEAGAAEKSASIIIYKA